MVLSLRYHAVKLPALSAAAGKAKAGLKMQSLCVPSNSDILRLHEIHSFNPTRKGSAWPGAGMGLQQPVHTGPFALTCPHVLAHKP